MHCPRCGHQQVSSETKFCSKCGFQLGLIPLLLQNGGTLPQLESIEQKRTLFNKKNGVAFGFLWLIAFIFLAVVGEIVNADPVSEICVAMGFFGFVAILTGSLIILPSSRGSRKRMDLAASLPQPNMIQGHASAQALPPQQQQPAGFYAAPQGAWRTPDTGELLERGSVVENTTKLLNHDERS